MTKLHYCAGYVFISLIWLIVNLKHLRYEMRMRSTLNYERFAVKRSDRWDIRAINFQSEMAVLFTNNCWLFGLILVLIFNLSSANHYERKNGKVLFGDLYAYFIIEVFYSEYRCYIMQFSTPMPSWLLLLHCTWRNRSLPWGGRINQWSVQWIWRKRTHGQEC